MTVKILMTMTTFIIGTAIIIIIGAFVLHDFNEQNREHEHERQSGNFGLANKYDAYDKCVKIIKSCTTYKQWLTAMNLPHMHYALYGDDFLQSALINEHTFAEPVDVEYEEI